jgi:outer membrane protein assembly factor BamA
MRRFYFLIYFIIVIFAGPAGARPNVAGGSDLESEVIVSDIQLEKWKALDGKTVHDIQVHGLVRTRLQAILWLIGTREGTAFRAEQLKHDLQILYNTGNLYDLEGQVEPDGQDGLHVTIKLKDKWTLFPALGAQGGGGSSTVGGGIFESNLLGYMTNASILVWTFNGTNSYDINANQEYFAGTDTMWSIDVQDNIEAQTAHKYDGSTFGSYAWRRQQKELMLGTHLEGPWRIQVYGSLFQDSIFNNDGGANLNIPFTGLQHRFYPKFIFGKVDWSNYQEQGFELTMQPTFANVFGPGPQYQAVELDYKQVWVTGAKDKDNTAVYFSTSHMTSAGPNFIYQVGGYYNIRGYVDLREFGRDVAFTNLEWRPFLGKYRWELLDLDLMVIQGCLFSDVGSAWGDSSLTREAAAQNFHLLWSAGAGLRINMVKFAGAILRLDWAQTLSPAEGIGFSFGVGQFF